MAYPKKPIIDGERSLEESVNKTKSMTQVAPAAPVVDAVPTPSAVGGAPKLQEPEFSINPPVEEVTPTGTIIPDTGRLTPDGRINRRFDGMPLPMRETVGERSPDFTPIWRRPEMQQMAPDREILAPAAPWKPEEVQKHWGPQIDVISKRLWERYQSLPEEAKQNPLWQMVGTNARSVATSLFTRVLMGTDQVDTTPRKLTEEQKARVARSDVYQWFRWVRGS